MGARGARRGARAALAILGLLVAAGWFAYLGTYRVDDAFIVYRYAENLAAGQGFAFNPGERVEGVTCFLWTVFLAPFTWGPWPLPRVAPVLSGLAGLAVLALLPGISARLAGRGTPDGLDVATSVVLAAHPAFAYWSTGALETVPFALLLVLMLRSHLREQRSGTGFGSAAWAGLATLVRPETPLLVLAVIGDRLATPSDHRLRRAGAWCLRVGAFWLPFLAFRRLYFGEWLPNTFYAKTGGPLPDTLARGAMYTADFFGSLLPGWGLPPTWRGGIGLACFVVLVGHGLRHRRVRPVAALLLLMTVAVVWNGGDWMVLWRFWVPGLPLLALLLVSLLRSLRPWLGPARRVAVPGLVGLAVLHGVTSGVGERRDPRGVLSPGHSGSDSYTRVARYLVRQAEPDDTVALMDIGQIGYETRLRVLDLSGLVVPWIARSPGGFLDKRYPVSRLLEAEPRFFVLRPGFPIDRRILGNESFRARYHRVLRVPLPRDVLLVFERGRARGGATPPR